jgi:hypothetical protein
VIWPPGERGVGMAGVGHNALVPPPEPDSGTVEAPGEIGKHQEDLLCIEPLLQVSLAFPMLAGP